MRHGVTDARLAAGNAKLAGGDEVAAHVLRGQGLHRHATYLAVQAMAKYVRARNFGLVGGRHDCHRERATTHNVEDLLAFLLGIV